MKIVLASDPGHICGWAMLGPADHAHRSHHGALTSGEARAWDLLAMSELVRPDVIACERFDLGQETIKMSQDPTQALRVIGALEWVAHKVGALFVMQPRGIKKVVNDAMLVRAGIWCRTADGHANDASRVLIKTLHDEGIWKVLP